MGKFLEALQSLESWFERQKRVLPWRSEPTVYRVWISEIMLQQTQVATVIPYFERFLSRFPTVENLAKASEEDVFNAWAGLGYYSRARNLQKGAKKMVQEGRFPNSREEWLEVPGVGPYTAGAILSISQDHVEPILDGNVERVLSRIRRVQRKSGESAYKKRLWRLSKIWVSTAARHQIRPSLLNQALMELGATVCTPRNPACLLCPIQSVCRAFQNGELDLYPPAKAKKSWIRVKESLHCILSDRGSTLLRLRNKGEWRAGLWDFPEEINFGIASEEPLKIGEVQTRHVVTHHKIERTTQVWRLKKGGEKSLPPGWRWAQIDEEEIPTGSAFKRTWRAIAERFPEASSKK